MTCKKCWDMAYMRMINNPNKSQYDHYKELLKENENNRDHYMEES